MRLQLGRLPAGELCCAGGLLAFGAFVVIYGLRYPLVADGVVGPGLMPTVSGLALAAASAVLLWRALRSGTAIPDVSAGRAGARQGAGPILADEGAIPGNGVATAAGGAPLSVGDFSEDDGEVAGKPTTVVGILALLVLVVLLAPTLGLIPLLGLLVFICVAVFERENIVVAALIAIGSAVASWLLFVKLFEVAVPTGTAWRAIGF